MYPSIFFNNLILKTKDTFDYLKHINKTDISIPKVIELDKIYLVGFILMLPESYNQQNILWENFKKRSSIIKNKIIPERYYLIQSRSKNNNDNYNFKMLGVETKSIDHTPDNFVGKIISSNKYLKFIHNGKNFPL